ncbi:neprilysin-2-like [Ixodes scapularis]|uniref:neprilysin-2-like n=1 Tax=Ixodes scapularis TaxID=6945 RepID=UPI001AA00709|nr:neprilysin-2-like [Ixodes scapularis]
MKKWANAKKKKKDLDFVPNQTSLSAERPDIETSEETSEVNQKTQFCVLVAVLAAIVVGGVVIIYVFRSSPITKDGPGESACHGPTCSAAENILKNIMNQSADPCNNFYNFVCGNYKNDSVDIFSKMTYDILDAVEMGLNRAEVRRNGQSAMEKAARLYTVCKNQGVSGIDDTEALRAFMNDTGMTLISEIIEITKDIYEAETRAVIVLVLAQEHKDDSAFVRGSEIHTLTPNMQSKRWGYLISNHSGNVYQSSDHVSVNLRALAYIDLLYQQFGDAGMNLLVAWEVLRQLAPLASPSIANIHSKHSTSGLCLIAVIKAMEVPALSVYLYSAVPSEAIRATNVMLKRIQASVIEGIKKSNWLDAAPMSVALQKVQAMTKHVGYPTHLQTEEAVKAFYERYPDVRDSFLGPWLQALERNMQWCIRDKEHFVFNLIPANAFYLLVRNIMVIMASVIRPPVYVLNGPEAFNFGGLGHVMGHEMMHSFDVDGSQRDATGKLTDWWTPRSRQYFENKTLCLRRSHQTAIRRQASLLNSTLDSENMADFLGLSSALKAFQEYPDNKRFPSLPYNSRQIFFISSCVKWCAVPGSRVAPHYAPWQQRCNVPLMNLDAFANAFQCPQNSPMNPANKCSFWS